MTKHQSGGGGGGSSEGMKKAAVGRRKREITPLERERNRKAKELYLAGAQASTKIRGLKDKKLKTR